MRRLGFLIFSVVFAGSASVVSEVRSAVDSGNLSLAESMVDHERAARGVTSDLAFARSWVARGLFAQRRFEDAARYAGETEQLCHQLLKTRKLDADPQLPLALGASIEVKSQAMAAQGARDQAVSYLREQIRNWNGTSIEARVQKNLNLLTLEGHSAPAIEVKQFLGTLHPVPLSSLRGHPVLLFFWAHWCSDCKGEIDVLQKLVAAYGPRGLVITGPTQHYGFVGGGLEAPAAAETKYMEEVREQYYARIGKMAVPVSESNFRSYGVSTTPTLVLVDQTGVVRLYHPGAMPYEELAAHVQKLLR